MYYDNGKTSIYYEKIGNGDKNILILPGWGDTRGTFYNIINYFKSNYTIYIFDYPGFGNSIFPNSDLTIYDYACLIKSFMEDNNIFNPIIIAHSFGGRITTLLTGYYNVKIDKLIMIDTASIKPHKTLWRIIKEKLYKFLKKLAFFIPKSKKQNYINKLINIFGSSDYRSIPSYMKNTFKNIVSEDLTCYLKNIKCETLILWGKLDKDTPLKDGRKINKLISNSAIIIFPLGGHFSYLDYPLLTNIIIKEFIK